MGRRSQHTPETLRRMIVDAAEEIVTEGGLALLSAREIAKRIEYSPGTLYNVFENLDDVVVTVEGRVLDRLARRLSQATEKAGAKNPQDKLLALAQAYLTFTHENPRLWNLLFEHHLPVGQELPQWYMDKLDGLLAQIEATLEPFFTPEQSALRARSARVLWSAVHGITSLSTTGKLSIITSQAAALLAEDLVQTYVAGLESGRRSRAKS
jgi:AcrR family transcriptional regulator